MPTWRGKSIRCQVSIVASADRNSYWAAVVVTLAALQLEIVISRAPTLPRNTAPNVPGRDTSGAAVVSMSAMSAIASDGVGARSFMNLCTKKNASDSAHKRYGSLGGIVRAYSLIER